jgi:carbonic anhydrase
MIDLIYRFDPTTRVLVTHPADPDEAVRRLQDGNRAFASLIGSPAGASVSRVFQFDADDLGLPADDGGPPTQRPFAAVLGCADARVPTELLFGQAANSLFVVRVAGNVLADACLGSLDYAVTSFADSLKLVVVLGHGGCGAVTAAADAYLDPGRYLEFASSHPVRTLVDRLFVGVRAAAAALAAAHGAGVASHPGYRAALIETAVALNAALTAKTVRHEFADRVGPGLRVVFGVYDLVSRRVKLKLPLDGGGSLKLAEPPADAEGFEAFARVVAAGDAVREALA